MSAPYTKSSSKTKGIARARANGQPTIPPVENNNVAASVRRLLPKDVGASAYEKAKVDVYMAKVEGRKAIKSIFENCDSKPIS